MLCYVNRRIFRLRWSPVASHLARQAWRPQRRQQPSVVLHSHRRHAGRNVVSAVRNVAPVVTRSWGMIWENYEGVWKNPKSMGSCWSLGFLFNINPNQIWLLTNISFIPRSQKNPGKNHPINPTKTPVFLRKILHWFFSHLSTLVGGLEHFLFP